MDNPPLRPLRPLAPREPVLGVAELNRRVSDLLARSYGTLWVGGEVSNFTAAASGHWYFCLKEPGAQVRAVMFRGRNHSIEFMPRDGDAVEACASLSLYEARGEFQLLVVALRRAGAGRLYEAFLKLRAKLAALGLFDPQRKRSVPAELKRVGVITSTRAAALRDVLITLARRAPAIEVVIYPTPVQGSDAPAGLIAALATAARRGECDVLLLVRGGGSIEDLWAFNDEALAHAIAASPIPVVSGVGHETDLTIADLVADLRAPTPTAAAEMVSPDTASLRRRAAYAAHRLQQSLDRRFERIEQRLDVAQRLLRSPRQQWSMRAATLAALRRRLALAGGARTEAQAQRLVRAAAALRPADLGARELRLTALAKNAHVAAHAALSRADDRLARNAGALELVSPQAVLARGYSIVTTAGGTLVVRAEQAPVGSELTIRLASGELSAAVRKARPEEST